MGNSDKTSIPKLKGTENFMIWQMRCHALLTKDGYLKAISATSNGTISCTGDQNDKALAVIRINVEDSPLLTIKNCSTAIEAWEKLENTYNPKGFTTEYLLLKQFFSLSHTSCDNMEEYLHKVSVLYTDLKTKGVELPHQAVIAWVLFSLDDSYSAFTAAIIQDLRKNAEAYNLESLASALIDEARGKEENKVLFVRTKKPWKQASTKGKYCDNCNIAGHTSDDCFYLHPNKAPPAWKAARQKVQGGRVEKPKKKGEDARQKGNDRQINFVAARGKPKRTFPQKNTQPRAMPQVNNLTNTSRVVELTDSVYESTEDSDSEMIESQEHEVEVNTSPTPMILSLVSNKTKARLGKSDRRGADRSPSPFPSYQDFILDSGASVHTVCKREYLVNLKTISKTVAWGNASTLTVKTCGDVNLQFKDTGETLVLRDVLLIPDLGINIISLSETPDLTAVFRRRQGTATLYTENNTLLSQAKIRNGLYILKAKPCKGERVIQISLSANSLIQWHERLGHLGIEPLVEFCNKQNIKYKPADIADFKNHCCESCLLSKSRRHINRSSPNKKVYLPLERIHSDVGGPLPTDVLGYKYWNTYMCKETRDVTLLLLKAKSDVPIAFKCFKAKKENNRHGYKIRELFTDMGGEYMDKKFESYLASEGIAHLITPAGTKEPNGLIERINLTLMNKARCILNTAGLPDKFWGLALRASTDFYNITPHSSLDFKTPFSLANECEPYTDHIKVWGSTVYYCENKHITKLQPRNQKGILVGYSLSSDHYQVWDTQKKKVVYSRDVTVLEGDFDQRKNSKLPLSENQDLNKQDQSRDPIQQRFEIPTSLDLKKQDLDMDGTNPNSLLPEQQDLDNIDPDANFIDSNKNQDTETNTVEGNTDLQDQLPQKGKDDFRDSHEVEKRILHTISDTLLADYVLDYSKNTKSKSDFILTAVDKEPNTYQQAMQSQYRDEWQRACEDEVEGLKSQDTYEIVTLPKGAHALKGRWVFKEKPIEPSLVKPNYVTNSAKNIRFKARWVVQGFNQRIGVDFLETFSTTCRPEIWRMCLIIAVNKDWHIRQFDVKNAFTHAEIDAVIYMMLPTGVYDDPKYAGKVGKLKKALYGLKQSPRLWYKYLKECLLELGFETFPQDEGVFIKTTGHPCIALCHVDDILIMGPNLAEIKDISKGPNNHMTLEELGTVATFLGNDISIKDKTLIIHQTRYTEKLLAKYNIYNSKEYRPAKIPGTPGAKLLKNTAQATVSRISQYQKEVGSLLYLALKTRPDITHAVIYCSRFMSNPASCHFDELAKVWKYLLYYPNLGLKYSCSGDLRLKGYTDSDWANDPNSRRSTSGYTFSVSGSDGINNCISWTSQLQKTVALSSCEAEYMALRDAIKESLYLDSCFTMLNKRLKLQYPTEIPKLLIDNHAAKKLAENPEFHKRSKHIDIIFHWTRQQVDRKKVRLLTVPTIDNLADMMTKNLNVPLHQNMVALANMIKTT